MRIKDFVNFGKIKGYSTSINSYHSPETGKYELLLYVYSYSKQIGIFINHNNLNNITPKQLQEKMNNLKKPKKNE